MTADERAIERLRNPKPGGRIAAARDYGVDLTLLIDRLEHTPEERLRYLEQVMEDFEELHGAARRRS
jgi:hypothetical protein